MDSVWVHLITVTADSEISVTGLLLKASLVVQLVLFALFSMSVFCWWIIGFKAMQLKRARKKTDDFMAEFPRADVADLWQKYDRLDGGPAVSLFRAAHRQFRQMQTDPQVLSPSHRDTISLSVSGAENVERELRRERKVQSIELESYTSVLATTASAAPFVGLFGTVWGIMESFLNIAREGNATLTTVAPGIAEALIATAIGLVAAIPAVIAYNWLAGKIRELEADMDNFSFEYLNYVKRHYDDQL